MNELDKKRTWDKMDERRRFKRWKMSHPASIRLEGAVADACCNILDISLQGIRLALGIRLEKDKFIRMRVTLSPEFILNIEAWAVWDKTLGPTHIYGLYFTQISDADKNKIYQFICHYFPGHIKKQICAGLEKEGGEAMAGEKFEDRRVFERSPERIPVRFFDSQANLEGMAETVDVSAKGLGLVAGTNFRPKEALELWLEIPDGAEPLYTRGEVVWSRMLEPDRYSVGISLEKADLMGLSRLMRGQQD